MVTYQKGVNQGEIKEEKNKKAHRHRSTYRRNSSTNRDRRPFSPLLTPGLVSSVTYLWMDIISVQIAAYPKYLPGKSCQV